MFLGIALLLLVFKLRSGVWGFVTGFFGHGEEEDSS
jgi:hypothetical protein